MIWLALYVATGFVVGAALFVYAEFHRAPGVPAPLRPGLCAIAAGLLWPVLLIGAAQCALVVAAGRRLSRVAVPLGDGPTRLAQHVG